MTRPEDFPFILDKTICVMKGMSKERFEALSESKKEDLRNKLDPDKTIRKNKEMLDEIEKHRESLKVLYGGPRAPNSDRDRRR